MIHLENSIGQCAITYKTATAAQIVSVVFQVYIYIFVLQGVRD